MKAIAFTVLFVQLRVISWIESLPTEGDPRNYTKNHETLVAFQSFIETLNEV